MDFLRDSFVQFLITTGISIIGVIIGFLSLPKKEKQLASSITATPKPARTWTLKGCLTGLLLCFLLLFAAAYIAVQPFLWKDEFGPVGNILATIFATVGVISCILGIIITAIRVLSGQTPTTPPLEHDQTQEYP